MTSEGDSWCRKSYDTSSRRRVLAIAGTALASGLAGCSDDSSSDDESDDSDTSGVESVTVDDSDTEGSLSCADIDSGYVSYTGGESALLFDFEYPELLDGRLDYRPMGSTTQVSGLRQFGPDDSVQFDLVINQLSDPLDNPDDATRPDDETVTEVEFGGETLSVVTSPTVESIGIKRYRVSIPYDDGTGVGYYRTSFQLELNGRDPDTISEDCDSAIERAAIHMVESLEPNSETSFGDPS